MAVSGRRRRGSKIERSAKRARNLSILNRRFARHSLLIRSILNEERRRPRLVPLYEDRRLYNPSRKWAPGAVAAPVVRTRPPLFVSSKTNKRLRKPARRVDRQDARLQFAVPRKVSICHKRKERRAVMFANGFAGSRGLLRGRRVRRNEFSEIGC